jgi:phytoene dehydrogenase-like protein
VADAIVIGAGPNGLAAAIRLADAGLDVLVLEAEAEPGGAVKTAELVEPGFRHDVFSSFYPLGAASPALRALGLEVPWRRAPLALAHPARDGSCAVLSEEPEETLASLGPDAKAWQELLRLWRRTGPALLEALVRPLAAPGAAAAAPLLASPVARVSRRFRSDAARRLFAGCAFHTDLGPRSPLGGLFGFVLAMLGHEVGWPCVEGGSARLTDALVRRFPGELRCGVAVERIVVRGGRVVGVDALRAPLVVAAIDAPQLFRLVGEPLLPARLRLAARRFRWDPATVKVDWTLDGPIPWTAADARRAGVVHVTEGGPLLLVGQYAGADPTRAPAGKETAWAYVRLPRGAPTAGVAERIEQRIEGLAPGFGALVRGRHVLEPAGLEARDRCLDGGAIGGGTARLSLGRVLLASPRTGIEGLYLGSASAYPGPGVHGCPGWRAAGAALRSKLVH